MQSTRQVWNVREQPVNFCKSTTKGFIEPKHCSLIKLVLILSVNNSQIGSVIVLVLGLVTLINRNFLSELLGTNLFTGSVYVLVITSAIACLLAFLGWFGAIREVKCMLLTVSSIACETRATKFNFYAAAHKKTLRKAKKIRVRCSLF